jgi:type IV pilus assembly protein PilC
MPNFIYVVTDQAGQKIKGQMDAKDRAAVINSLRKNQLIIISVKETKEKQYGIGKQRAKVKLGDLVVFSRQMAALVKAGIPLVKGLNILSAQVENEYLKVIISSLISKIESGSSLSDAMSNYSQVFSPLYINMVKAGEFSGALDNILDRLALYLESTNKLNHKVKAALIYPTAVILVALLLTTLIFYFVIPKFKDIFTTIGVQLPLPTLIVIKMSELIKRYILVIPVLGILLWIFFIWLTKIPKIRLALDNLKLNLPIVGKLIRKIVIARFSRTLGTLLKSGVSILPALEISSKTSGNKVIESTLDRVVMKVSKGERIGESLSENKVFAPLVINLIAVGEETGDIPSMLDKIASFYEDEVDASVSGLTSLIEPFIIIFLGGLIGGIVMAMFLPILRLTQLVGR